MMNAFPKPLLIFFTLVCVGVGALGLGWLYQNPSGEELYGDTGRYVHEFCELFLGGEIQWWSSNYLSGHSSVPYLSFSFPSLLGVTAGAIFGDWVGVKVVLLLCLVVGAVGVYLLTNSLLRDPWVSSLAGVLSFLSPQLLLRVADFEHYHSVICVSLMPFALWSVVKMSEDSSPRLRIVAGLIWSGMLLSYPKLVLMFVPPFAFFLIWVWVKNSIGRRSLLGGVGVTFLVAFLCSGILMFPVLREYQWTALFQPNELEGWQKSFSIKSLISIFDRNNSLLADMPAFFRADRGQFYFGIVALFFIGVTLRFSDGGWLFSRQGGVFRLFSGMALFSLWLCHGPQSPLTGMLEFLNKAQSAQHWVPALAWVVFFIPGILIFFIFPVINYRLWWAIGVTAVYYFVPGFVLLETLPLFRDIRAPWGFWEVSYYSAPIAAAVAVLYFVRRTGISQVIGMSGSVALIITISVLDLSGYWKSFYREGLPTQLFEEFTEANSKLEESEVKGRVYPVSGRYFELRVPVESKRGLCTEASWMHFQMRPYNELFRAAHSSTTTLSSYFALAGVSHMVVDKKTPFMPKNLQKILEKTFSLAHDSEYIGLWENKKSLAPGFLSKNYISVDSFDTELIDMLLGIADWLPAVAVEIPQSEATYPHLVGSIPKKKMLSIDSDLVTPYPLTQVDYLKARIKPTEFDFPSTEEQGPAWLVVTEAWHPDWVATGNNGILQIRKAFGGLMAVWVTPQDGEIRFRFQAPRWYNFLVWTSVVSWFLSFLFLIFWQGKIRDWAQKRIGVGGLPSRGGTGSGGRS